MAAVYVGTLFALMVSGLGVQPLAAQPTRTSDKWVVNTAIDEANGRPIVIATLRADDPIKGWPGGVPTLAVRCQTPPPNDELIRISATMPIQPGLDVFLVLGVPARAEHPAGTHTIEVRFDDSPLQLWGSVESSSKDSLFIAPIWATRMIVTHDLLANSRSMLVRFAPLNSTPELITFDTRGFAAHAREILSACPKVDRSKWTRPLPRWSPRVLRTKRRLPDTQRRHRRTYRTRTSTTTRVAVYLVEDRIAVVSP